MNVKIFRELKDLSLSGWYFKLSLLKAKEKDCREVFIAGGQQIYNAYLPVAAKIYITRVHAVLDGDAFFPAIDEKAWKKVYELDFPADEKHAYAYSFQTWVRV